LEGSKKMSKSLGNYVAVNDSPSEMFGKLMSISDELMARYYELLLRCAAPRDMHPLEAKKQLAFEIVQAYHSVDAAKRMLNEWNTRFSKRDLKNADLPAFSPGDQQDFTAVTLVSDVYRKVFQSGKSHSEVSRLIKQGSVEIDGTKIRDPKAKVALHPGQILRLDRKCAVRIA
jgi:tyrosyl-tRNA synthetase